MNRLIVPPLPAASRPSNRMTTRVPGLLDPVLQLQQLDLQQPLGPLVLLASHPLGVRIALAPGVHRPTVGAHQHRLVVVAIVHPQVRQLVQQVAGLGRGADVDNLVVSAHPNSLDSSGVR